MKKHMSFLAHIFSPKTRERGQILLIVVLVMVVALTVGLSVATRSITNVRTTTEEENSQRAFSAAEAGIERALKDSTFAGNVGLQNNANIKNINIVSIQPAVNATFALKDGKPVTRNVGWDVWFADHNADGSVKLTGLWPTSAPAQMTVYWNAVNPNDPCTDSAALEIIFVSYSGGAYATSHKVYDPCTSRNNQFTTGFGVTPVSVPTTNGNVTLYHKMIITGGSNLVVAKLIPLYKDAIIAVSASPQLPVQGQQIESTGESGETFRKITVNKPYPQLPTELFNVLFSP